MALLLVRHRTEHVNPGLVLWNVNGWLPVSEVGRAMALVPKGNTTLHAFSLPFLKTQQHIRSMGEP